MEKIHVSIINYSVNLPFFKTREITAIVLTHPAQIKTHGSQRKVSRYLPSMILTSFEKGSVLVNSV
jgi:hypothetical protein